ncbi:Beta-lactamase-like domain protein [Candidatus Magnetomorum sp. HK-1]|nr:Beta-lactamase-like domain protein [Candidatus Magnetomorum sp. HK-1]
MDISIERIVNGPMKQNCYILSNSNKEAVIIDPGSEDKRIQDFIQSNELSVLGILATHAHLDHIGGVQKLVEFYNVPFYLHSMDSGILRRADLYKFVFKIKGNFKVPKKFQPLDDKIKTVLKKGAFNIQLFHTPGHTKGSVSFLIQDHMFSGDLLLKDKIGRTDLPGGDNIAIKYSLRKLTQLQQSIHIHPGHYDVTTIVRELKQNIELRRIINEG